MTRAGDWLDWDTVGRTWPHRAASRFVKVSGYRWHVQLLGPGNAPPLLLIHGTGAASFSWRTLIPRLMDRYRLIVPDLPCHGFTQPLASPDLSLEGMTVSLRGLLHEMEIQPKWVLGHSAGAVIGVSLVSAAFKSPSSPLGTPRRVLGINGALKPIRGSRILSPMAKALFANPLSASLFSLLATATPLGSNLLATTGSQIDADGERLYRLLLGASGHVRGALGMMASWDLSHLNAMLRRLSAPLDLFAAQDDPMVPSSHSQTAARLARDSSLTLTATGGHLVHETSPDLIEDWMESVVCKDRTNGMDAA